METCPRGNSPEARVILFAIRAIHTAIFVFIGARIVYIFNTSLTLRRAPTWHQDRPLFLAIGVVIAEGFVLALNRWKCPLTSLAQRYGGKEERIADIFLPKVFSPYVLRVLTAMFAFGSLVLIGKTSLYGRQDRPDAGTNKKSGV